MQTKSNVLGNPYDQEWVKLIILAKEVGIKTKEIRTFFNLSKNINAK